MRLFSLAFLCFVLPAQPPTYLALFKGTSTLAYLGADGKVLASVPVGRNPHEMVFSSDRKLLYTTDNGTMRIEHAGQGGNTLSIVDVAAKKKIGEIPLGQFHRPHGIALDPKTGNLVVTTEGPDRLLLIDTARRSVIRNYDTKGKTPHMVALGRDGKVAYVSNSGSGTVAIIHLDSGRTTVVQTGARPEGSVVSLDGKEVYVANRDADSITVIDTAQEKAIANITTGKGPVRIVLSPDGKQLAYALMNDNKMGFADPKLRKQTDYTILPDSPVSCTLSADGKQILASAEEKDRIFIFSLADHKLVGEIRTAPGSGPDPVTTLGY